MAKEDLKIMYDINDDEYKQLIDFTDEIAQSRWNSSGIFEILARVYNIGRCSERDRNASGCTKEVEELKQKYLKLQSDYADVLKSNQEQKEILEGERRSNTNLYKQLEEATRPQFVNATNVSDECLASILASRDFVGTLEKVEKKVLKVGK